MTDRPLTVMHWLAGYGAQNDGQGREPALHRGVVVCVAPAAHAAGDAVCGEHALVVFARVWAALVGVVQESGLGAAASQRLLEGAQRQVPVVGRGEQPTTIREKRSMRNGASTFVLTHAPDTAATCASRRR